MRASAINSADREGTPASSEPWAPASGAGTAIWRNDLIAVLLSGLVIGGLLLDGWNHLNILKGRLGSFFTPWHGLLYAGFTANAAWVVSHNKHLWDKGLEPGSHLYRVGRFRLRYPFAMAGLVLVFVGMVGDLVWHTVLGEETDVARVIAPFHVILFSGASLLIAAPLRSAWYAPSEYPRRSSFVRLLPAILSVTLIATAASFMLQWTSPFMEWSATPLDLLSGIVPPSGPGLQTAMAARIVLAHILLVGPLLLAMRRWVLPPGTATLVFTFVAMAMSALTSFALIGTILAALVGGLATDATLWWARQRPRSAQMFLLAAIASLATWPLYFVILAIGYGGHWPVDFYLGVTSLAGIIGLVLAFFAGLPEPPEAASLDWPATIEPDPTPAP